ncbi:MAG: hypothetical protein LBK61_07215 [Spirochaetaceae bacterium]|jgi:hypothetical protein|nr:hypothetical protein [Spirochaetaceae bacterium]
MAVSGQITKDYWICPPGASQWIPVATIAELKGPIEARRRRKRKYGHGKMGIVLLLTKN